jgi:hypothetical protein
VKSLFLLILARSSFQQPIWSTCRQSSISIGGRRGTLPDHPLDDGCHPGSNQTVTTQGISSDSPTPNSPLAFPPGA